MQKMFEAIALLLSCLAVTAGLDYHKATLLRTENAQLRTENEQLQWEITNSQDAQCKMLLSGLDAHMRAYEYCVKDAPQEMQVCVSLLTQNSYDLISYFPPFTLEVKNLPRGQASPFLIHGVLLMILPHHCPGIENRTPYEQLAEFWEKMNTD